jgi:hypothetical protein
MLIVKEQFAWTSNPERTLPSALVRPQVGGGTGARCAAPLDGQARQPAVHVKRADAHAMDGFFSAPPVTPGARAPCPHVTPVNREVAEPPNPTSTQGTPASGECVKETHR